jgi:hypothetical protein
MSGTTSCSNRAPRSGGWSFGLIVAPLLRFAVTL